MWNLTSVINTIMFLVSITFRTAVGPSKFGIQWLQVSRLVGMERWNVSSNQTTPLNTAIPLFHITKIYMLKMLNAGHHIEYCIRFWMPLQRVRSFFTSEINLSFFFIDKLRDKSGTMLLYDNPSDMIYKKE